MLSVSSIWGYNVKIIDFRSDTVTKPTPKMRKAMFEAEVGDDVYGDDPTVWELERRCAQLLNKEAALFVPSGTFGNQLAIMTHTSRGDEVIVGDSCHILKFEVGAAAVLSQVQIRNIPSNKGMLDMKALEQAIRGDDIHFPNTGLICLENAHSNGRVVSLEHMKEVFDIARLHKIPLHLDGARIFNAATTLNVEASEIAQYTDSVMFCLSKGLCAPVGSMLVGDKTFIEKARKNRKLMGGGLRQVGILAAAGLVAVNEMISNLKEDHEKAKYLEEKLKTLETVHVFNDQRDINFVYVKFDLPTSIETFRKTFNDKNIKISVSEDGYMRLVTNHDIEYQDIDLFIETFKSFY